MYIWAAAAAAEDEGDPPGAGAPEEGDVIDGGEEVFVVVDAML